MGVTPQMRAMLRHVVEVQTIPQERISVLEVPQLQIQEVVEVTRHPPPKRISESIVEQLMLLRKSFVNNDLRTGRWRERFSLWCQQPSQLSQLPFRSLVPPDVLARVAQAIADVYDREQSFTMDSRPSHVGGSAWFLSCAVCGVSPSGWSVLEVTQRRLVLCGTRLPEPPPLLCTFAPVVSFVLLPRVSQILIRV